MVSEIQPAIVRTMFTGDIDSKVRLIRSLERCWPTRGTGPGLFGKSDLNFLGIDRLQPTDT